MKNDIEIVDKDFLKSIVPLLVDFYRNNLGYGGTGPLHITLEDGNVDDGHIRACKQGAEEAGCSFSFFLAAVLEELPRRERLKLYKKEWRDRKPRYKKWPNIVKTVNI